MDQPNAPLPEPPSPVAPDAPPAAPEPEPPQGITVDELLARITPRAWVTPTLAVLIVLGFAIEIALGVPVMSPTGQQLLKAGGEFGPLFAEGEWWRALTSMFLHAGPLHLAFNLWAFWSVGHLTERVFGNKAFLTIYVFSGIGGSLASLAWSPLTVGVGASGAIFGVYGALLAFVVLHRGVLPPEYLAQHRNSIVGFIGYNVVFGLSQKNTDMAAHAGGLLTGALAGSVLGRDLLRPAEHALRRALTAVGFAVLLLLVAVFVRARLFDIPEIKADRAANDGLAHLQAKRYPQAIESYTQALTQNREHHWLFNRGLAYYSSDNLKLAQQDMRDAHALQSGAATDTMLCEIGVTLGGSKAELEEAAAHCSAALPLAEDPKKKAALLSMRAIARGLQERDDESGADADAALVLDDGAVMARAHRAQLNLEKGDLAVAESDCGRLLAAEPRAFDLDLCARVAHARKDGAAERVRLDGLLAMRPADQRAHGCNRPPTTKRNRHHA